MPSAYLNCALSFAHVFVLPLLSHARGKKKRHSWKMILEEPLEHPRCEECSRRVGDRQCEGCNVHLCDSCAAFAHPKVYFIVHLKVICSGCVDRSSRSTEDENDLDKRDLRYLVPRETLKTRSSFACIFRLEWRFNDMLSWTHHAGAKKLRR